MIVMDEVIHLLQYSTRIQAQTILVKPRVILVIRLVSQHIWVLSLSEASHATEQKREAILAYRPPSLQIIFKPQMVLRDYFG